MADTCRVPLSPCRCSSFPFPVRRGRHVVTSLSTETRPRSSESAMTSSHRQQAVKLTYCVLSWYSTRKRQRRLKMVFLSVERVLALLVPRQQNLQQNV